MLSCAGVVVATNGTAPAIQAATYTVGASQNTMAYEFLTGWVFYDLYPDFIAPTNTGVASPHSMNAYIQYDLSSVSAIDAASVSSATLRLYVLDNSAIGFGLNPSEEYPVAIDFYTLTAGWDQTTLTWSNQPAPDSLVASISDISSVGYWLEIDVTSTVKEWLDGSLANYGLLLTQSESVRDATNTAIFPALAANRNPDESIRPQLVITTAIPEPSTYAGLFALLALSAGLLRGRRKA